MGRYQVALHLRLGSRLRMETLSDEYNTTRAQCHPWDYCARIVHVTDPNIFLYLPYWRRLIRLSRQGHVVIQLASHLSVFTIYFKRSAAIWLCASKILAPFATADVTKCFSCHSGCTAREKFGTISQRRHEFLVLTCNRLSGVPLTYCTAGFKQTGRRLLTAWSTAHADCTLTLTPKLSGPGR